MKIEVLNFKGELPIVAPRELPAGYGTTVVNAKLVSGDLESFPDIGNFVQLGKAAPINTIWKIALNPTQFYLQWSESEIGIGTNIDVTYGTVAENTLFRVFITGLAAGPQQTNLFYATDPSQQGANPLGAYPYVTFPMGIAAPAAAPAVVPPVPTATTAMFEYSAPTAVNSVVVNAEGAGYTVGDTITPTGGTLEPGLPAAQFVVTEANDTGGVTALRLAQGGFYAFGAGPGTTNAPTTGGTGAGLTVNLTVVNNTIPPWNTPDHDNHSGYYAHTTISGGGEWELSTGQGDIAVLYLLSPSTLATATTFDMQVDHDVTSSDIPDVVIEFAGSLVTSGTPNNVMGPTVILSYVDHTFTLYSQVSGTNGGAVNGSVVSSAAYVPTPGTEYRIAITATGRSSSGINTGFQVTATLATAAAPGTVLATVTGFVATLGEVLGVGTNHRQNHNNVNTAEFKNIQLSIGQPPSTATGEATSYVYTYVTEKGAPPNDMTEESGPSTPSPVVTFFLETDQYTGVVSVTPLIVTIPAAPSGQYIASYNLYRLVQQLDGSEIFQFVVNLPASTTAATTYTDTNQDGVLGAALRTAEFVPPNPRSQGITALTNGVVAVFYDNVLSLSPPNYPYAFPVQNQLATDFPIVAIAPIDTSILVLTTANPYTAFGTSPDAYSMSKETTPAGCVSKRSVAFHRAAGVIYASNNGLYAYRGLGNLDAITTKIFNYEQWVALNPPSIIGQVHDDYYVFWFSRTDGTRGGYMLDLRGTNGGLIELDFHVTAACLDGELDFLQFVPDRSEYPINGAVVTTAQQYVGTWEYPGEPPRPRTWEREGVLLPRDATFQLARVYAEDYDSLNLVVSSEGGVAFSGAVTSPRPFIIAPRPGREWAVAVSGASRTRSIELVESAAELVPG